jgi:hypothetical protein
MEEIKFVEHKINLPPVKYAEFATTTKKTVLY